MMRRNVYWAALVAIAALLQTTWFDVIRVQGVVPDVVLLFVVYFALTFGEERAMFTGVIGGMFQDVAANATVGHYVLCHVVVAFAAGRVSRRLVTEHPAVKLALVFVAVLVHGLLFMAILYLQQPGTKALHMMLSSVAPRAFYTTLAAPVVFGFLDWVFRRITPLEGGVA